MKAAVPVAADASPGWSRAWRGDLLAAAAGVALPFAFSPWFVWPLSVLSLSALFCVWSVSSVRRAAWRGWLYGLGSFGAGVSWIVSSFQFSQIALPVAIVLTSGFVAFLAFYPALIGALVRLPGARSPLFLLLLCPSAWILGEWLRGWFFTGFTWLQVGYAQVDGVLAGVLPLFGVYGTGLAVALCSGALAWFIVARSKRPAAVLIVLSVGFVLLAQWGLRPWTEVSGASLRVALLQGNVPQEQKWLPSMRLPTLQRYWSMTSEHLGADLIIWPETALPGDRRQMAPFIDKLHDSARAAGSAVMFGVPEYAGNPGRAYNTVELAGSARGRYRKRHLVPFGEYLPFDVLLRPFTRALGIPVSNFAPGDTEQAPLIVNGQRLAMFICYEIVFGNEVIASLPQSAVLVTVSNDAWFGDSIGPHQHLQMARTRALETGRDVLRATNTGITAIIDATGTVQARLAQFSTAALAGQVTPRSGATPYVRFGDVPALLGCVVLLLIGIARSRRAAGATQLSAGDATKRSAKGATKRGK